MEDEDRRNEKKLLKILVVVFAFLGLVFIGNLVSSSMASNYGLTYSEMSEEVWLVNAYIIAGLLGIIALSHTGWPRLLTFALKILLAVLVFALVHNQFATSKELAGIKHDFAVAASHCRVKGEELVCGKELKEVLERRDSKLAEMSVVMLNDWRVTAVRSDITMPHRAGAYLFLPF